ncbi:putative FAD-containing monooxygenase [Plectosphaerella cucumerina]|uniref:FAD-containing monooxygenase n=1 Tax=Plectosphaerella cucumerina TaxID=40658 RepID=A0A8K0TG66_9PEZI|nr:putative FAD-containing monooxygenase [Plectosphaerella cucumerina]
MPATATTSEKKLRCIVIGAGVSGILIAIKLQEAFGDDIEIAIFEKNFDVGGTWLENRYPGCACDVPSHIYQYSFSPNPNWSTFYAPSAEIRAYLKAVAFHHAVDKYMFFNSTVTKAQWNEGTSTWTVFVADQGEFESEILFNAGGILNHFQLPSISGLDTFKGPVIHTANWDEGTDLCDKRVAIIGAGASAIQTLPAIRAQVKNVDVYIRTPSWIMGQVLESMAPAGPGMTYTEAEQSKFRDDPVFSLAIRKEMEAASNRVLKAFVRGSPEQIELRARLETRMRELVPDSALQASLIPEFDVGCRRLSPGEPYLEALQQANVSPVFDSIDHVTADGIITSNGTLHPADVIIAATGFNTSFRPRFPILGRDGKDLRDLWATDPIAYCGLAVSGFPNYLVFLGPNTPIGNGTVMGTLEATADYFVRLLRKMKRQGVSSFDVRAEAQADFDDHTREVMEEMVWTGRCNSWYKNSEGKIVALWPGSSLQYREVLAEDRWEDYEWRHGEGGRANSILTTVREALFGTFACSIAGCVMFRCLWAKDDAVTSRDGWALGILDEGKIT